MAAKKSIYVVRKKLRENTFKVGLKGDLSKLLRDNECLKIDDLRDIYEKYYKKKTGSAFKEVMSQNLFEMEEDGIIRCVYDSHGFVKEAIYIKRDDKQSYCIDYNFKVTYDMIYGDKK